MMKTISIFLDEIEIGFIIQKIDVQQN